MASNRRHVLSLPLSSHIQTKLISCGFSFIEDFEKTLTKVLLKNKTNLEDSEVENVIDVSLFILCHNIFILPIFCTLVK